MLLLTDTAVIVGAAAGTGTWLYTVAPHRDAAAAGIHTGIAFLVVVVWTLMGALMHTRDPRLIGVGAGEYKRVTNASAATFGALALGYVLIGGSPAREFVLLTWPVGLAALLASRWLWRNWLVYQRRFGHFLSNVVVVGQRSDVSYVVSQLMKKSGAAYDVVGVVLEGKTKIPSLQVGSQAVPVVGNLDTVRDAVKHTGADAVIVAGQLRRGSGYLRELGWDLERTSTELVVASSLTNVAGPRIKLRPVEGLPLMHVEMPSFTGGRHVIKRCMDVVVSAVALLILAPLLAALAVLIKRDSAGPVIFSQERTGKNGSTFRMYKLRSMVTSAEEELERLRDLNQASGPLFKLYDDPRVTRVGKWLRKYSLDELPQLYNVLRGDMSLVGPRPPLPTEVSQYVGHTHRRLFTKPGCTGLWQVNGRSDLDWDESVRLDLYYVENWSVTGDLIIMWRTLKVMLNPKGSY
ncbi:sugar transferase [Arthrobacter sp. NPDC089319]|uniref:sugar transferase n=1 Tax=Arthrobacter sp. NPDC089319 TaxID=3155915 RepID=UPI00341F55AD